MAQDSHKSQDDPRWEEVARLTEYEQYDPATESARDRAVNKED